MNIFHLDPCPKSAAEMLCDKHVPKMLLESCQMLCTGYQKHVGVVDTIYKSAYVNHPMTIWVGHSKQNWIWLFEHATAIAEQYTLRYNRVHKSQRILSLLWFRHALKPATKTLSAKSRPFWSTADAWRTFGPSGRQRDCPGTELPKDKSTRALKHRTGFGI